MRGNSIGRLVHPVLRAWGAQTAFVLGAIQPEGFGAVNKALVVLPDGGI
jgi:hypothetical protein